MLARMDMPPHARAGWIGRGHRFAAYPRCSTDSPRASTTSRLRSLGVTVSGRAELDCSGCSPRQRVAEAARCPQAQEDATPRGWPGPFGELGRVGSAFLTASSARPEPSGEAEQIHIGLSPQRNFGHTSVVARSVEQLETSRRRTLSNKGMKLTKPEHIGASQLIPGVLRTVRGRRDGD